MAREKKIEEEFDIIEDVGDQALFSYYNDAPSSPEQVPITDKVKQGITNLGFMFTTNGSKKVELTNPYQQQQAKCLSMSEQLYSSISRGSNQTQQEAYIFAEKFFQNNSSEFQERFERLIWITYCK